MNRIKLVAAVTMAALLPVIVLAQKTSFDYDKSTDFTKFKTYAFKDGTKVGDPLIDKRIVTAMEAALATKGLTKNDAAPDVVVVYHVAFDKSQDVTAYSTGTGYGGYGYHYGGGFGSTTTDVRVTQILTGTLMIDIADAKKKEIVWRGLGVKEVDVQAKAEKRDKNITNAVTKIFKNYPPPVKK